MQSTTAYHFNGTANYQHTCTSSVAFLKPNCLSQMLRMLRPSQNRWLMSTLCSCKFSWEPLLLPWDENFSNSKRSTTIHFSRKSVSFRISMKSLKEQRPFASEQGIRCKKGSDSGAIRISSLTADTTKKEQRSSAVRKACIWRKGQNDNSCLKSNPFRANEKNITNLLKTTQGRLFQGKSGCNVQLCNHKRIQNLSSWASHNTFLS